MEEDEAADTPPFWLQASGNRRRARRDSSALLLLLFLAAAVAFVVFVVPPFLSIASQILRPRSVKKGWDAVNVVLVLFAIICGFLSRSVRGGDEGSSGSCPRSDSRKSPSSTSNPSTPYKWYDSDGRRSSDRGGYGFPSSSSGGMRNSSSYPDLRAQDSPWTYGGGPRRFYDDTHLVAGRGFGSEPVHSRRRWNEEEDEEEKKFETKRVVADDGRYRNAAVEEMEVPVTPPPYAPPPPPPPPPETPPRARASGNKRKPKRTYGTVAPMTKYEVDKPPAAPPETPPPPPRARAAGNKRKPKRAYETVAHMTKDEADKPPAPPPPPPPPPPVFHPMEEKSGKKRGGSATKEFLGMLMMNRKKQRQKSIENLESLHASQPLPSSSRLPPTPPPLPPPPSVFHALFTSKKGKTRKALPAPPPPPPAARGKTRERPAAFPQSTADLITINRSHTPVTKGLNYESSDDSTNSGGLSPSIPIPLPPPPPPFKVAPWKFAVSGDYVRIKSTNSWRHGTPDTEDNEGDDEASVSGMTESPSNASSEATSPAFCPSPDVDTKADRFIARFRDGLTLEKMNSIKQRRSNLAPERTG